jgi:hypothetical protein
MPVWVIVDKNDTLLSDSAYNTRIRAYQEAPEGSFLKRLPLRGGIVRIKSGDGTKMEKK